MEKKLQTTWIGRVLDWLKKWPLHVILLPAFFVISIYVELAGLLQLNEIVGAFLKVLSGILILFTILYFFYKDKTRSGIVATVAGILFLFFGTIKDFLAAIPVIRHLSSYTALAILLPIAAILFLSSIRRARTVAYPTLFLNLLFIVYLCIEVWKWQALNDSHLTDQPVELIPPASKEKLPDIYYIILDSYPSSQYQQEVLGCAPNFLDSALLKKGFYLVNRSTSNYHITSFSVASTLQMQYLAWMKNVSQAKPRHYSIASTEVKGSAVLDWLQKNDYTFYNLSVFDLPGEPSINRERFFSVTSEETIYYNTLWNRVRWQIIPALQPSYAKKLEALQEQNNKILVGKFKDYNQVLLDSLQRLPISQENVSPKFIYAHFEMPHYPYFYDSTGNPFSDKEVFSESMKTDKRRFMNYIAYTNNAALSIVDIILNQKNKSIIILQSDHGTDNLDETRTEDSFSNYSALYFPDGNYQSLYKSMSNVNTFRVIFNKYFHQQLPLLADSSIYMRE